MRKSFEPTYTPLDAYMLWAAQLTTLRVELSDEMGRTIGVGSVQVGPSASLLMTLCAAAGGTLATAATQNRATGGILVPAGLMYANESGGLIPPDVNSAEMLHAGGRYGIGTKAQ